MNRFEAWCVHVATLLVGGTGLVYAWMLYVMNPTDPYAVVNHPWQPWVQHLHVWAAPLLVFGAGLIWRNHVWAHWQRKVRLRRRSGTSLLLTLVPMIVSGYLIQTAVSAEWRNVWMILHLTTSGLWILGYLGHFVQPLMVRQNGRSPDNGRSRRRVGPVLSAPRTRRSDLTEG